MKAQVVPGSLSFVPGADHPFGYSRMDVVWSGFSVPNTPGANYWINFGVLVNNGSSGQCVQASYTQSSKNAALTTGTVSANSSSVTLTATNVGSLGLTGPMTLFSIYYVGSPGTSVSFTWRTSPQNQVININNTTQVWYPSLGSTTSNGFTARTISGAIYKAPITQSNCNGGTNAAVTGVTVNAFSNETCTPAQQSGVMTNLSNGNYSFAVNGKFNYTISPIKSNGRSCGGAVNSSDASMLQQHIINNTMLQYRWQAVAGDMNLSGSLSTADINGINQVINGTFSPPAGWDSWAFPTVAAYYALPAMSFGYTYSTGFATTYSFTNLSANQSGNDFLGIKRGDVDGSCSDCGASNFSGEDTEDRSLVAVSNLKLGDASIQVGTTFEIPVRIDGWEKEIAIAFALSLPTDYIEIMGIKEGNMPHLSDDCFNWQAMQDGLIRFAWANLDGRDIPSDESKPMFYLQLKAKRSISTLQGMVEIRPDIQDCSMTGTSGRELLDIEVMGNKKPVEGVMVYPNPATSEVNISFEVPNESARATLQLFGIDGKILYFDNNNFVNGTHSFKVPLIGLPDGLINYRLMVADVIYSGKFSRQY